MWFPLSVLFLLAAPEVISRVPEHAIPEIARWGWLTSSQVGCCLAGYYAPYGRWHWMTFGLAFIVLFYCSYVINWDAILALVPASGDFPWWDIFILVNIILPFTVVMIGPARGVRSE